MIYQQVLSGTVASNMIELTTPPVTGILLGIHFYGTINAGGISLTAYDETDDSKMWNVITDSSTNHAGAMADGWYLPTSQSMNWADASVLNPRQQFAFYKNRLRISGTLMTNGQTGEWRFILQHE